MRVAIYGKIIKEDNVKYISQLLDKLQKVGAVLCVYEPFLELLQSKIKLDHDVDSFLYSKDLLENKIDFLFSIGGDGTLLGTIDLIRDSGIPIVGFNTGRMGIVIQNIILIISRS